ncbi:MAG: MBL fold metallo-hydrolase [Phycisphaerae bacterium]|nr:MBL fold metallo-hydrolase [Phycisphaerae bacterium]
MMEGRITVLVENTAGGRGMLAEHGLSFWIEIGSRRILFDTGQSDILLHNARVLGIDLRTVDAIVLSHGHYDHVGGLKKVLEIAPGVPVYLHPLALEAKYARRETNGQQIGMESEVSHILERRIDEGLGSFTDGPIEIIPGVWATGQIPRKSPFENTGGPFYRDPNCTEPDELLDDQALVLEAKDGLVVVLGCAHAGVVSTLDYVAELFPNRPIQMVMGGMHLVRALPSRIAYTIDVLRRYDVQRIGPAHCTGDEALRELWDALPQKCFMCNVGTQIAL